MNRRRTLLLAAAALLPAAISGGALAQGGSQGGAVATPVVEGFHAALIAVMRDAQRLGVRGREQRLRPAIEAAFNLPAMTRIAVGPPWTQMQPAQQQALVAAFSDWSVATYAHRFDGFGGESFQTLGETTTERGDRLVRTQLNRPNDAPVQLNYLMREAAGGQWRIVDVYLTGTISELASRRAEFTNILRDGGPERLVQELRQRTETMLRG